jgi:D-alanyl-D-alanine carboxypeptidase (penicillin-binding protein 5/6)
MTLMLAVAAFEIARADDAVAVAAPAASADGAAPAEAAAPAASAVPIALPTPPALPVKSAYLVDFASGEVLLERNPHERLEPASVTKLMTAYVVFQALADGGLAIDDEVLVSEKAWRMDGTRMFIEVGSTVSVENLLRGLLIQSGNDAAVALAEHVAGSVEDFAELMNEQAAALGMRDSQFRNPHGLPARGHYTTARDLAVLAAALIADFPDRYALLKEREYSYNGINQYNRNALLRRDDSVDGLKTGHTDAAGYCIVTSAERSGMRLIAVVLGAKTANERNEHAQALVDYGFAAFETHRLYAAGEELGLARVRGGAPATTPLALERDLFVTIPRGRYEALAATLKMGAELVAPLASGTHVGEVVVELAGSTISQAPVVVLGEVADGGFWTQLADGVGAWLE